MKERLSKARKIFKETFRQAIMKGETVEVALKKADCAFDGVINGEETQDFQEQEAQDFQEQNAQA